MRPLYKAIALVLPLSVLLPGCPLDCGAYDGAGDAMYRRGEDSLFLCTNGGFTAHVGARSIEGRYQRSPDSFEGTNGETGAREFTLHATGDGTWSSTELGAGWQAAALDPTALDHASIQCSDLETRAWWTDAEG